MDALTLGAIAVTAVAVVAFFYATWSFLNPARTDADRLAEFTGQSDRVDMPARVSSITRSAAKLSSGSDTELASLRKWLSTGGFRQRTAPEVYNAARTVGLVFGAVLVFLLAVAVLKQTSWLWMVSSAIVGAAAGYYAPWIYVTNVIQKRKESILNSFPDALDLLVSAVEAGLGLDAAFRRVAEEMELTAPELAQELQLVNHEFLAGIARVDALRRMEERVGIEDVTSLVNVLIQADRFGSSVSRALRVHAGHIRIKRMQRAETKAAQVSPKMTVVMIIFILPTLLIILLGPAAISVTRILMPAAADKGVVAE